MSASDPTRPPQDATTQAEVSPAPAEKTAGHRFPNGSPPPIPNGPNSRPYRPWPARYAFLTAWLAPAATGRRMSGVTLRAAYGVHLASALATIVLVMWLAAWEQTGLRLDVDAVSSEFLHLVDELKAALTFLSHRNRVMGNAVRRWPGTACLPVPWRLYTPSGHN